MENVQFAKQHLFNWRYVTCFAVDYNSLKFSSELDSGNLTVEKIICFSL